MTTPVLKLPSRAVLRLTGPEARSFLQGLVTNDVMTAGPGEAVYAALLTPQGKFMFDMMVLTEGDDLLLDIEAARKADLIRRLMMYKLRANVDIVDEADLSVWVSPDKPSSDAITAPDPRHPALGWRTLAAQLDGPTWDADEYEAVRIRHGVPDSSRDMALEKDFWLETDAERLNGVSFTKGCFIGQELTARMKHRTTLKKRLVAVCVDGGAPEIGAKIQTADGKSAGEIRSASGNLAIAYLRLEYLDRSLTTEGRTVTINDTV